MKKFRFTLQKLLNFKTSVLQKEKNTLAALRARQNRIREQIRLLDEEKGALNARIRDEAGKGIRADRLRAIAFQVESADHRLKSLKTELENTDKMVEKQLNIVIGLTKEKDMLEKLREKQLEEYRYEEARENELTISEFVSGEVIRSKNA
jgi:flagellar FliJ protein